MFDIKTFNLVDVSSFSPCVITYLSNALTNSCIALYCILWYCVILKCIVLLIYFYVDITKYNGMHKFVRVLDKSL